MTWYSSLFSNWHLMRWIALLVGLALGASWFSSGETVTGLFSLFFLFQAVTNTGCMAGSCRIPGPSADPERQK